MDATREYVPYVELCHNGDIIEFSTTPFENWFFFTSLFLSFIVIN